MMCGVPETAASVRIRPAAADEAGEILTVQRAGFVAEAQRYRRPDLPPLTETAAEVRAAIEAGSTTVFVAELDQARGSRLVGAARLTRRDGTGHVTRIVVAPDLQGAGIGGRLLAAVHDAGEDAGEDGDDDSGQAFPEVLGFELTTGTRSGPTLHWYAGHGYETVGSALDAAGVEVAVLRRPLLGHGAGRPRARVACYVTAPDSADVLVFDHVGDEEPGTQVPAGGIRPGETVARAAVREVAEETGLTARFAGVLGYSDRPHPGTGAPRRTAYVRLELDHVPAREWVHGVSGDGADAGLRFACRWAPPTIVLADEQHEFLATG